MDYGTLNVEGLFEGYKLMEHPYWMSYVDFPTEMCPLGLLIRDVHDS